MQFKHFMMKWVSIFAVILGTAFGCYELFHWMTHVYEFDARIKSDLTRISSRVNGTIDKILVKEGDKVKLGDLLVIMNRDGINHKLEALNAERAGQQAKTDKLEAEKKYLNIELDAQLATKKEKIHSLEVELKALLDRQVLANKKLKRTKYLVSKNLTSEKALDNDQDHLLNLSGQVSLSRAKIKVAQMELREVGAKQGRIDVLDKDIQISVIEAQRLEAQSNELKVELSERLIKSPVDGIIDIIYKNPGEYVEDADELLVLHDPQNIWIEANIEEDQIRHLQLGQPVKVDFNAYPFDTFTGQIISIGKVTLTDLASSKLGSADSRARKLTQRIPVKIDLTNRPEITAPGMLVEVNIQIQDKAFFQ